MSEALVFRKGMAVKRFHTRNLVVDETVGHHTCNVAWLVVIICESQGVEPGINLIKAALMHDVAEQWTGDIPATAKWESEQFAAELERMETLMADKNDVRPPLLTQLEYSTLKEADMLDLVLKMFEELRMGNMDMLDIYVRGRDYLVGLNTSQFTNNLLKFMEDTINGSE